MDTNQFTWKRLGHEQDFCEYDPEGTPLSNFRINEALGVNGLIQTGKQIIAVNTDSGFGISKFLIPKLREIIGEKSCKVIDLHGQADLTVPIKNTIVILDEIPAYQGNLDDLIGKLSLLSKDNALQFVLLGNFVTLKSRGLTTNTPDFFVLPKLFNISQSVEYITERLFPGGLTSKYHGSVFRECLDQDGTFNVPQLTELIEVFAQYYPLHFRTLNALCSVQAFTLTEDGHVDEYYSVAKVRSMMVRDKEHLGLLRDYNFSFQLQTTHIQLPGYEI